MLKWLRGKVKAKKTFKERKKLPFEVPEVIPGSPAEVRIHRQLTKLGVPFIREHSFPDLINYKTGKHLRFDFWIPERNLLIEYNGKQHYQYHPDYHSKDPVEAKHQLTQTIVRDCLKKLYAKNKGIKLVILKKADWFKLEDKITQIING